jgi:hypothetical protein
MIVWRRAHRRRRRRVRRVLRQGFSAGAGRGRVRSECGRVDRRRCLCVGCVPAVSVDCARAVLGAVLRAAVSRTVRARTFLTAIRAVHSRTCRHSPQSHLPTWRRFWLITCDRAVGAARRLVLTAAVRHAALAPLWPGACTRSAST